ncbi:chromosomal replication initiator protein DnaA [Aestuariivirga litoralis]|uniref:chromosomal replication initiator protein DnaA n=1 Tax=Aestuariivirga litoralis TaxID=2650924 RepID=UPI0018C6BF01|nr:chromosomal replication initiator protein DnaA [Aestuariivirga litoralis]MBG1232882.1 chromosomal replication initiator protein DnaA [Aestuariivirga litoralis]
MKQAAAVTQDVSNSGANTKETLKEGWGRVAARLKGELGDDLFNSWFARMEAEDFVRGNLTVSVPTRFLKSWIENHYATKLRKVAETEFKTLQAILVRVRQQGEQMRAAAPADQARIAAPERSTATAAHIQALLNADRETADESQTFDNYVVGQSNLLAHAAVMRVAQAASGQTLSFNPLYIHSAAGLGKTHLLNALAQKIRAHQPARKVLMLTAERFMYGFIHAIRSRDTLAFKDQFQNVDVLLIDDFQFLQGKAMQQEFCHAFNSLVDSKRQVVIAADVPPTQLDTIDQRMRSRLQGGLVVDIETPDLKQRRHIVELRYMIMLKNDPSATVSPDILDLVAERITGGGRELEGALNKLVAYQQFNKAPVTLDLASMVLRDAAGATETGRVKIEDILKVVSRHFNVGRNDLLSARRAREVVMPRQIGMYLAKKLTARSLPEIGRRFGGRDHSTVLHAVRKIDEQMKNDEKLARELALLIRLVEQQ